MKPDKVAANIPAKGLFQSKFGRQHCKSRYLVILIRVKSNRLCCVRPVQSTPADCGYTVGLDSYVLFSQGVEFNCGLQSDGG